jgi:ubiquitin-conjugating enzyme E2 J2
MRARVQDPIPNIEAQPDPSNILEWHFVIIAEPNTPYAGGVYHGKLVFPPDYPFKPPGILFVTPSGRFKPGSKICFSFSDFHPEAWNPIWHVATILNATQSFMNEESRTAGSVTASNPERKKLAQDSLANSCKNPHFRRLFPHWVDENQRRQQSTAALPAEGSGQDASRQGRAAAQQSNGVSGKGHGAQAGAKTSAAAAGRKEGAQSAAGDRIQVVVALLMLLFAGALFWMQKSSVK